MLAHCPPPGHAEKPTVRSCLKSARDFIGQEAVMFGESRLRLNLKGHDARLTGLSSADCGEF